MARHEANRAYWVLETNTPFFGWGQAGRIESTAVAVAALASVAPASNKSRALIDAGLDFLLHEQDHYGVWYSGQTTVRVLETLLGQLTPETMADSPAQAIVVVNGRPGPTVSRVSADGNDAPVMADLTPWLGPGDNTVEVRSGSRAPRASVQIASSYYLPWEGDVEVREGRQTDASRTLRLAVTFDRTSAAVGEEVHCAVEVERVAHRGYGMLLAEIGLPPGAEVDRAALDRAMADGTWSLFRYEIRPDRVVFYVWPTAGGTTFTFAFRPRVALRALSAPSILYDYYNPEAQAVVTPVRFTVAAGT
jgi:hypothetical protein